MVRGYAGSEIGGVEDREDVGGGLGVGFGSGDVGAAREGVEVAGDGGVGGEGIGDEEGVVEGFRGRRKEEESE